MQKQMYLVLFLLMFLGGLTFSVTIEIALYPRNNYIAISSGIMAILSLTIIITKLVLSAHKQSK